MEKAEHIIVKREANVESLFYLKLPRMITNLQALPINEGAFRVSVKKSRLEELLQKQELSPRTEELCCVIKDLLSATIDMSMVYAFNASNAEEKLSRLVSDISHEQGYKLQQACILLHSLISTGLLENTRLSEDSLLDILIPRLFEIRYNCIHSDIHYCKLVFQYLLDISLPAPTGSRGNISVVAPPIHKKKKKIIKVKPKK